jgi:hypothetical protein
MKNERNNKGGVVGVRLTRKSYRRKLIMFGFSIFMSLALTATGFAAWVLSKDAVKNTEGQVQVGAVTEASIEITDIIFTDTDTDGNVLKSFLFEPLESDTTGRVRNNGEDFEDMDLNIQWTVNNYQLVGDFSVEFKLPDGVYKAIKANYITLPAGFTDTGATETVGGETYHILTLDLPNDVSESKTGDPVLNYTYSINGDVETVVFTLTLKFGWGTAFGGENPGTYYDTNVTGKDVDYDIVKATLNRFKTTMHNMTFNDSDNTFDAFNALSESEQAAKYAVNPISNYLVVIRATVK